MNIFQIEVTNDCNLKCWYCPRKFMKRGIGYIELKTVETALKICRDEKQTKIGLHHFGEPLLHRELDKIIALCHKYGKMPIFSTNGLLATPQLVKKLAKGGTAEVIVSIKNDCSLQAIKIFLQNGFRVTPHIVGTNSKPLVSVGGTIKGVKDCYEKVSCSYIKDGWWCILWDGQVVRCCNDFNGATDYGNISTMVRKECRVTPGICDRCKGYKFEDVVTDGKYEGDKK